MTDLEREAIAAACDAARAAALVVVDPRVVYAGSSVIIALGPEGPIARVGGTTQGVRDLVEHYAREIAVASWLAGAGAPVVRPWETPGPFSAGKAVVSFWALARTEPLAGPEPAGHGLRHCHRELARYCGPLPPLSSLIDEARRIVESVLVADSDRAILANAFEYADHVIESHGLSEQAVHGDAGLGNVLAGGIWHDWEDTCRGPLIWDLASLVSTARITGRHRDRAELTLRAYGNAPGLDQLDQFVAVRGLQVLAWSLLASTHEQHLRPSTITRLHWLRHHDWQV